jgi:hypothetical protein
VSSATRTRAILTFIIAAGGTFAAVAIVYELGFRELSSVDEYTDDELVGTDENVADESVEEDRPARRRRPKKLKAVAKPAPKPKPERPEKPKRPEKPNDPPGPSIQMPTAGSIRAHRLPPGVTADALQAHFSRNRDPIERCLKKSVKAGEKFAGTVYLQVTIDQWGKISESHIKNSELDYSVLGSCILARTGGGGYPAGEKPITVGFPIRVVRHD